MEVDEGTGVERSAESARDDAPPTEQTEAAQWPQPQIEFPLEAANAQPLDEEQETPGDGGQEEDNDHVSVYAPGDDNLLMEGDEAGGRSPPNVEDEHALMHTDTDSPGMSRNMSNLSVESEEAPQ